MKERRWAHVVWKLYTASPKRASRSPDRRTCLSNGYFCRLMWDVSELDSRLINSPPHTGGLCVSLRGPPFLYIIRFDARYYMGSEAENRVLLPWWKKVGGGGRKFKILGFVSLDRWPASAHKSPVVNYWHIQGGSDQSFSHMAREII